MVLSLMKYSSPTPEKSFFFLPVNNQSHPIGFSSMQQSQVTGERLLFFFNFFISSLIKLCCLLLYFQGPEMYGHCFKETIGEKSIKDSPLHS